MLSSFRRTAVLALAVLFLSACESNPPHATSAAPDNPSPTAGGATSERANQMADKAMYKEVDYKNASRKGPVVVVVPGDIKSNNATFTQKFGPNNIADFGELELGRANFSVLERSDLGPLMREFQLAYTMGNAKAARKVLQKGKYKTTKWVVKFDILKAEQVAQAAKSFDGQTVGRLAGIAIGGRAGYAADTVGGSIKTGESTGVWVIGMRFKIMDANTTEQRATGYTEEKMEVGATATSVLGFSEAAKGGVTLDTMVQRLVQKLVWEIDSKYK
jgi:PAS domain-containing protein